MNQDPRDDDAPPRRPGVAEVTTIDELAQLDDETLVRGYLAGFKNSPDFSQRDKAYWHGYLNGQVDGGHSKSSEAQQELARLCVSSGYLKRWVQIKAAS